MIDSFLSERNPWLILLLTVEFIQSNRIQYKLTY